MGSIKKQVVLGYLYSISLTLIGRVMVPMRMELARNVMPINTTMNATNGMMTGETKLTIGLERDYQVTTAWQLIWTA
ncbi:hypothetical protein S101258_00776 [Lactiplantibacillus plantarum subsp. plantarum]|uniref:Uncharacterized protein n=1 Tax=Lactiplantibacillus plantarum subsp. plantarum TaxID=337330 RepID=A0A2S3U889_LACPN|nr:hypothetical protein S101258_00776 [Lactiplantibacillus plantarum subsp. plantarum]